MSIQSPRYGNDDVLQSRIADTLQMIKRQEVTIARLSSEGRETADATKYLRELLITLADLNRDAAD